MEVRSSLEREKCEIFHFVRDLAFLCEVSHFSVSHAFLCEITHFRARSRTFGRDLAFLCKISQFQKMISHPSRILLAFQGNV